MNRWRHFLAIVLCAVLASPAAMVAQATQSCPDPRAYVPYEPPLLAAYSPAALESHGPWARSACTMTADASTPCAAHMVYVPSQKPGAVHQRPLVVFLPGTGQEPRRHTQVLRMAAYAGYSTIGLSYDNQQAIELACRGTDAGTNCHGNARAEAVTGQDLSSIVTVQPGDSVLHRLYNLLIELHRQDIRDGVNDFGWNRYYRQHGFAPLTMSHIRFDRIIVAGFSQGGGHAAYISKNFPVVGTVMIDAPFDTAVGPGMTEVPADWLLAPFDASAGTPRYGIGYAHPFIIGPPYVTLENWQQLGLLPDAEDLDAFVTPPIGVTPPPPLGAGYTAQGEVPPTSVCSTHASMAKDSCIPTSVGSLFPAPEPNYVHLFHPYLLRFCYACPSGMCP